MNQYHHHMHLRWLPLIVIAGISLNSCVTPKNIESISQTSRTAKAQSDHALIVSKKVQAQSMVINRRLKMITENQVMLTRRLEAMDRKLAKSNVEVGSTGLPPTGFFQHLAMRAKITAEHPYKPQSKVPSSLMKLDYDQYSNIRFHGKVPGWSDKLLFQPDFYPAGYLFNHDVKVYLLKLGQEEPLQFPVSDFNFSPELEKSLPSETPLTGFGLYYPFGDSGINEFLAFQGSSYFRAVGSGQTWGLSARGVAIDTALSHVSEEFPYFSAFWIIPPEPGARSIILYARLDSPSLAGACRFIIHPGEQTIMDVKMVLYIRKSVKRLGIAPLTSMFLQGGGGKRYDPLLRSVHDSDGLSIESKDGQWEWYPLRNPKHLSVRKLPFDGIKGFGLMQRSRQYSDYLSYGLDYQKRPSAWITPTGGDWGKGHIVLVELPTNNETNDNITTFWEPEKRIKPGDSIVFDYRISWQGKAQTFPPLGHVSSTRYGHNAEKERYVINFHGGDLDSLPSWIVLKPNIHIDGPATLDSAWVAKDPASGLWRLEMVVKRDDTGPVRVRATLDYHSHVITETWVTRLPGK